VIGAVFLAAYFGGRRSHHDPARAIIPVSHCLLFAGLGWSTLPATVAKSFLATKNIEPLMLCDIQRGSLVKKMLLFLLVGQFTH